MAKNPFGRNGILDYLPQTGDQYQPQYGAAPQNQQNQAAMQAIAGGLQSGGYQAPAQDAWGSIQQTTAPDWGNLTAFAKAATPDPASTIASALPAQTPPPAAPAATPPASQAQTAANALTAGLQAQPAPPAPGGPPQTNLAGLSLPAGWNAAGNKFAFNIPTSFQANTNLYQMGYDPSQDKGGIDVGRGPNQTESYLNRVYGWMNAVAKQNGFADVSQMPPDKQSAAMGYAVGRLRTDSFNIDPSGAAWQRTGFAGYDKYMATQPPGTPPPPAGTQPPGTPPPTTTPPGTQPPGTSPPPVGTQPPGTQPPGTQPPGAGTQPPGTTAPLGDDPTHQNKVNQDLAGSPETQMRVMLQKMGIDPDDNSIFGQSLRNTMSKILPAFMQVQGAGDQPGVGTPSGDLIEQNINRLAAAMNGKGGFNQFLNTEAARTKAQLGPDTWLSKNISEGDMMATLGNITNLATRGMSPLMQNAYFDYYKKAMGNETDYRLAQDRAGTALTSLKPVDWLRNSQWADLLR